MAKGGGGGGRGGGGESIGAIRKAGGYKTGNAGSGSGVGSGNAAERLLNSADLGYASFDSYRKAWPGATREQRDRLAAQHGGYASRLEPDYYR